MSKGTTDNHEQAVLSGCKQAGNRTTLPQNEPSCFGGRHHPVLFPSSNENPKCVGFRLLLAHYAVPMFPNDT